MKLRWTAAIIAIAASAINSNAPSAYTVSRQLEEANFSNAPVAIRKSVEIEYPLVNNSTSLKFFPLYGISPDNLEIANPVVIQINDKDSCDSAARCKTIVVDKTGLVVLRTFARSSIAINEYGLPGGRAGSTFVLDQGCGPNNAKIQVDVEYKIELSLIDVCSAESALSYFEIHPKPSIGKSQKIE
jgi:hypothetical protein